MTSISFFLPSLTGGGAERAFVQLANQYVALHIPVDFVLAEASGPYLEELSANVRVVDLGASGVLHALPKLIGYLRAERPSVMLSGLDHANVIAVVGCAIARRQTRCVIAMRSVPSAVYGTTKSLSGTVLLNLMRLVYRFADDIIVNSRAVAADASRLTSIPPESLNVIYNPLNVPWIDKLSRETVGHPWCAEGAPPVILGLGRLDVLKDFPTLIEAFDIVRAQRVCRLVILGEGPERERLERLIRDLDLESDVYLPGFVKNPFGWLRQAKVFVSSSLTEGCPNAIMQALACGTPVVATDCIGGSREILEEGKWGRLVGVSDSAAMAEAIEHALQAPRRLDLRQRAHDFSHDRIAAQYLRVLLPDCAQAVAECQH